MSTICAFIQHLGQERGATAIEYAVIAGLISIAAVAGMSSVGAYLSSTFSNVASSF